MGTAPPALPEGASTGNLCDPPRQRQVERLPCRHRTSGGENVLSDGKTDGRGGRCHGGTESGQSYGVNQQDEQHPK